MRRLRAEAARDVRRRRCHRCGAVIISGTDDHSLDVVVDVVGLSVVGEALAIIDGRRTWAYTVGSRRNARELWRRTRDQIGTDPGASDLLTGHDCEAAVPDAWSAPSPPPRPAATEEVPF